MEHINNSVLIQGATLADIERMIDRAVANRIAAFYESVRPKDTVMVKRKDAAVRLGVSLPTLDSYARAGIIHARHLGGRVFYSEEELSSFRSSRRAPSLLRP